MEQNKINGQLYRQVFITSEDDLPKKEGNYLAFRKNPNEIANIHIFPGNKESRKRWMDEIDWYLLPVDQQCTCGGYPDCICDITKAAIHPDEAMQELNDCIEKATPGLSKIKDVDKSLDEIRGIQPDINTPFFGNTGAKIPIEPNQTAEEILSKYKSLSYILKTNPVCNVMVYYRSDVLKAMKEYTQSQQSNERPDLECDDSEFLNDLAEEEKKQTADNDKIMELLNKYTTTSLSWMKDAHQNFVIDPMDYHKIAEEYAQSQPEKAIELRDFLKWFNENMENSITDGTNEMVVDRYLTSKNK